MTKVEWRFLNSLFVLNSIFPRVLLSTFFCSRPYCYGCLRYKEWSPLRHQKRLGREMEKNLRISLISSVSEISIKPLVVCTMVLKSLSPWCFFHGFDIAAPKRPLPLRPFLFPLVGGDSPFYNQLGINCPGQKTNLVIHFGFVFLNLSELFNAVSLWVNSLFISDCSTYFTFAIRI